MFIRPLVLSSKHYALYGIQSQTTNEGSQNFLTYHPNVNEVDIFDPCYASYMSISSILDPVISLTNIVRLNINYAEFCIGKLIELLYFSPNVHTLKLNSISFKKIDSNSIQKSDAFNTILNKNKIINLTIRDHTKPENILLFTKLCPRLERLTVRLLRMEYTELAMQKWQTAVLSFPYSCLICFLEDNQAMERLIDVVLRNSDWTKSIGHGHLYAWGSYYSI